MNDKALIVTWFGQTPPWWDRWVEQLPALSAQGYDVLIVGDEHDLAERALNRLSVVAPDLSGRKSCDYRCAFGLLYEDVLAAYKWWGHTDADCVYGRLDHFVTDAKLDGCDVYTDCAYDYVSGPFSLYRNVREVNDLFLEAPEWHDQLTRPDTTGWVEKGYSDVVRESVRLTVEDNHAYTDPEALVRRDDGALSHRGRELAYFHFRRTKEWPL